MINQNMYFVKAKVSKEWQRYFFELTEKWVEGCLVIANDKKDMHQYTIKPPNSFLFAFPIEPETICKSTGLEDNYRKIIYEKDVVEICTYDGQKNRYLIWWNQEMSMMTIIPLKELEFNGIDYYCLHPTFTYNNFCLMMRDPRGGFAKVEIVGNIIDDPELVQYIETEKDK